MLLKLGSKGNEVVTLQRILKRLGLYAGSLDGVFDSITLAAVVQFQTIQGLDVDGLVGNGTWGVLRSTNPLEYLFIHCTATPQGRHYTGAQIIKMHTDPKPKGRGWSKGGYADIILLDGTIETMYEYDDDQWVDAGEVTNGAVGFNNNSKHISYVGGVSVDGKRTFDTRTPEQKESMAKYIINFVAKYPDIKVIAHYSVAAKSCPSFYLAGWLREIGIPEKNIYDIDTLGNRQWIINLNK